jgi:hypothetical protein
MYVNSYFSILSPPRSNPWFQDTMDYDLLKKRVLANELKSLSAQDCSFPAGVCCEKGMVSQSCGNIRMGIYIKAILNSATLKEAARLYSHLSDFPKIDKHLCEKIKKRLLDHNTKNKL